MLGSKHVSDEALLKANDTIRKMFAYRHDILKAMIADGARLVVLGRDEKLSDLPEFKDAKNKAELDLVRYLDYTPTLKLMVVPEENVLGLPGEPFAGKCMVVSVFAKGLYRVAGLRPVDPGVRQAAAEAAVRAARQAARRGVRQEGDEALRRRDREEAVEGNRRGARPLRVLGPGGGRPTYGGRLAQRRRLPADHDARGAQGLRPHCFSTLWMKRWPSRNASTGGSGMR